MLGLMIGLLVLATPVPPAVAATLPATPPVTMPRTIAGQITSADYPPSALRNDAEGRTHARLIIDTSGRVTHCSIARSSGHAILDQHTCDLALRRMRFSPGLDAAGQPILVHVILPVVWAIDDYSPPAPAPAP